MYTFCAHSWTATEPGRKLVLVSLPKPEATIEIFGYLDYRAYVRDRIAALRETGEFSERTFAQEVGFGSPSYLKMILDGKRNLGAKFLAPLARRLGLKKEEARFFAALVAHGNAKTDADKKRTLERLQQFRKFRETRAIDPSQYAYFTRWYFVAVREALSGLWRDRTPRELARALGLQEKQVEESLVALESLGLIERAATGGGWKALDAAVKTPVEVRSLLVREFHKQMIHRALVAIDRLPVVRRDISALTLSLDEQGFRRLKEKIADFRASLNAELSGQPKADKVIQVTIQAFPLLDGPEGEVA